MTTIKTAVHAEYATASTTMTNWRGAYGMVFTARVVEGVGKSEQEAIDHLLEKLRNADRFPHRYEVIRKDFR